MGQGLVLQGLDLDGAPVHVSPLYLGAGELQYRKLVWVPPPHDTVHSPKLEYVLQPPLIGHSMVPHCLAWIGAPAHRSPPYLGVGFVHRRNL